MVLECMQPVRGLLFTGMRHADTLKNYINALQAHCKHGICMFLQENIEIPMRVVRNALLVLK